MSRQSEATQAFESLRDEITVGRLGPESRLDPRALAQQLEVSVDSINAGVARLADGGMVDRHADTTFSVRRWLRPDAEDLFAIRRLLEGLAARLCAARATDSELAAITTANDVFCRTLAAGDIVRNVRADLAFHNAIVHGADSPELSRLLGGNPAIGCSMVVLGHSLARPVDRVMGKHVTTCHDPIIAALLERDAARAEQAAHHHVDVASKRAFGEAP